MNVQAYLQDLVSGQPADYVEIRLEETRLTQIQFRGPVLDTVGESVIFGGNVRALVKGGWGFASFNSFEGLGDKVALAVRLAEAVSRRITEGSRMAPVPLVRDKVVVDMGEDPRLIPLAVKKEVLESYNRQILDFGPPLASSSVRYFDRFTTMRFVNSEGTRIEQERLDLAGSVTAIATRGGVTQMSWVPFGSSRTFAVARGLENRVAEACRTAAALLDAQPVVAGEYTVILDPGLAGLFAHEAFGHLSEADAAHENPSLLRVMALGREFGGRHLNIFDTGDLPGTRGYLRYDDEGVAAEKTYLIREGKLVGRLHSRQTAAKMGEKPTGNARALDYRFPPICRMRATCIEAGEASFEDMLEGIELGVYVRGSVGGQTAGELFTFNAADGRMIRGGRLAELVREVSLSGNVFTTLKNIDLVGRDFAVPDDASGCGKGGQHPLPTSLGSPHVRIRNVVVGGRAL